MAEEDRKLTAGEIEALKVVAAMIKAGTIEADSIATKKLQAPFQHKLSTGWVFVIAWMVIILGVGSFFIVRQLDHNKNTIHELQHRAENECLLLNGRRSFEKIFSNWLQVEADEESQVPEPHGEEALHLKQQIDHLLETERITGCKLLPLPKG